MMTIVVPCKSLKLGKSRLAGVLTHDERESLCRRFLSDTLQLAASIAGAQNVKLVSTDPAAQAVGMRYCIEPYASVRPNLNAALHGVAQEFSALGDGDGVMILPIDIPLATPDALKAVLREAGDVVIVPDRKRSGTNVLLLRGAVIRDFRFAYGENSFASHCATIGAMGKTLSVVRDRRLEFDIDDEEDYLSWKGAQ